MLDGATVLCYFCDSLDEVQADNEARQMVSFFIA